MRLSVSRMKFASPSGPSVFSSADLYSGTQPQSFTVVSVISTWNWIENARSPTDKAWIAQAGDDASTFESAGASSTSAPCHCRHSCFDGNPAKIGLALPALVSSIE